MKSPLFFLFLILFSLGAPMASAVKISDHFDGERFFNPEGDSPKSFYDILKWKFSEKSARWPRWVELKKSSWQPLEKREKRGG